ncbi:putative TPR region domain-containing protein [Phytophthora infestans]|nr:putative TPR region domain-containing protein [Phytophthora infestans]
MEAMKNEGNALFQQQRFAEAVHVYTSVLNKLQESGTIDERLETAVRLNRAWARIQMPNGESGEATLAEAEQDCSRVIAKDASCVKAFYRRALARERRGLWKLAMEDALAVKRLEPGNPSIAPLLERLHRHSQEENDLTSRLQQSTISSAAHTNSSSRNALAVEAEDAWEALQAAEVNLRMVYKSSKKSSMARRKPKSSQISKGDILQKTDDVWESLRREEITTVAKAFPRSKKKALT